MIRNIILFIIPLLIAYSCNNKSNTKTTYFVADVDTVDGKTELYTEMLQDSVVDVEAITSDCNESGLSLYEVTYPDSLSCEDVDTELRFYLQYNEQPDDGVKVNKLTK